MAAILTRCYNAFHHLTGNYSSALVRDKRAFSRSMAGKLFDIKFQGVKPSSNEPSVIKHYASVMMKQQ